MHQSSGTPSFSKKQFNIDPSRFSNWISFKTTGFIFSIRGLNPFPQRAKNPIPKYFRFFSTSALIFFATIGSNCSINLSSSKSKTLHLLRKIRLEYHLFRISVRVFNSLGFPLCFWKTNLTNFVLSAGSGPISHHHFWKSKVFYLRKNSHLKNLHSVTCVWVLLVQEQKKVYFDLPRFSKLKSTSLRKYKLDFFQHDLDWHLIDIQQFSMWKMINFFFLLWIWFIEIAREVQEIWHFFDPPTQISQEQLSWFLVSSSLSKSFVFQCGESFEKTSFSVRVMLARRC